MPSRLAERVGHHRDLLAEAVLEHVLRPAKLELDLRLAQPGEIRVTVGVSAQVVARLVQLHDLAPLEGADIGG